jgi:transcription elongation factor Elf1
MEEPTNVECPWCGEIFVTFCDISQGSQSYIEDCQVCCRPIQLEFFISSKGRVKCRSSRS